MSADEAGQGLPEYGLLVAGIVVMVVGALIMWDDSVNQVWTSIGLYLDRNAP